MGIKRDIGKISRERISKRKTWKKYIRILIIHDETLIEISNSNELRNHYENLY